MVRYDLTRRQIIGTTSSLGIVGLAGCAGLLPEEEEEPEPEPEQEVTLEVPRFIHQDGTREFDDNGLRFVDYSNLAHGLGIASTAMRQSQWGHPNYDESLFFNDMVDGAVLWLDLVENNIMDAFTREIDGTIWPYLQEGDVGWERVGTATLEQEHQYASYVYHVHHRSGRFVEQHHNLGDISLFRELTFTTPSYQAAVGRHILDERRDGGQIFHNVDQTDLDNESMAYGLAGANTQWYAWVRWSKPSGWDDMTRVPEDTLQDIVGHHRDFLGELASDIKAELDQHWDDSAGVYAIDGTTYPIDAAGGIIRGTKVLYDALFEFYGDQAAAMDQFEKTTRMFDEIYESDVWGPEGIPEEIQFTANGVEATSTTVDLQKQYQFLGHLTNGYSLTRDRFTDLLADNREDIFDHVGEIADALLLGTMDNHLGGNGIIGTEADAGTGSLTDDRAQAATVGIFTAVAVEAYGAGTAFASASDWDDVDPDVAEAGEELYDLVNNHRIFIQNEFLQEV